MPAEIQPVHIPNGWMHAGGGRADDADLAVLLVNSYDVLATRVDRLVDVRWLSDVLATAGHAEIAADLTQADLYGLRRLREQLREVFHCTEISQAARILNPMLLGSIAVPLLVPDGQHRAALCVAPGAVGYPALAARLPTALAQHIGAYGLSRLGVCAAKPCSCVFIDHTRPLVRRYCSSSCNDRAASTAYRLRRRLSNAIQ